MQTAALLYTRRFDFPYTTERPKVQLMIASMPRAGSTMFGIELWKTGLFGAPLEYANRALMIHQLRWKKLLRHELRYWRMLQRVRTGPNGVFSYKFFVQDYAVVNVKMPKLLSEIAPTYVVYLTRGDKLGQAISYSKAIQSGKWFSESLDTKPFKYNEAHIKTCLKMIEKQEEMWERVFAITGAEPLRVTYEELLFNRAAMIKKIKQHVFRSSVPEMALRIPQIEMQRDSVSEEWRRQFLEYNATDGRSRVL